MNRIIRILVLLMISTTFMQVVQANNITIYPIEDTYIDSSYPNDNFVGDTSLHISKSIYSSTYIPDETKIGLLKFDMSKIPPGSIITSAKLRLKSYIVSSTTPHIAVYNYSNNNWDPTKVTWDNFPTGSDEYLSELGIPYGDKYYFFNILPAVNNNMLTLRLKSTRTSNGYESAYFSSLNIYDQEDRPILIINYSTTPSILVKTPNKGENWLRGTTKKIKWSSIGDTGANVKIELLKGGLVNEVIASSTPNNGSFSWNISAAHSLGSDYKISIESTTNSLYKDVSNKNFIISTINCG